MMGLKIIFTSIMVSALLITSLFAQTEIGGFPIPEGDLSKLLVDLFTNYKALGTLGVLSLSTLITVQVLKNYVSEAWKYKRLATLTVSIVYSIIAQFMIDGNWILSAVLILVTYQGATAFYETLKGLGILKKK